MKPDRHTDGRQMEELARALKPGQAGLFTSSTGNLNALQRELEQTFRKTDHLLITYVTRLGAGKKAGHLAMLQKAPFLVDTIGLLEEELPPIAIDLRKDPHWVLVFTGKLPAEEAGHAS